MLARVELCSTLADNDVPRDDILVCVAWSVNKLRSSREGGWTDRRTS